MHATATDRSRQAAAIARQNDLFRRAIVRPRARLELKQRGIEGRTVCTPEIRAQGLEFLLMAAEAVAADETFTKDIDPHGDHAFGRVEVRGKKVWWKIDLHDPGLVQASDRPHDPACTVRVLTVFFAHEH